MRNTDLFAPGWLDYELLDSGDNRKLERFGKVVLVRPETQALWEKAHPEIWAEASAEFKFGAGKGSWIKRGKSVPDAWPMAWRDISFSARLTSFKHTGIFPEQAVNWEWIAERVRALKEPKVLNLFGYTGIASLVAAKNGALVTHVDASRQSNAWSKENMELSGIPEKNIRYVLEDALKFAEREVRRGASYDGIILDPPAFGRGPKKEVWKIEESLPRLLGSAAKILSAQPGSFLVLNGYAAGYSPISFARTLEGFFPGVEGEFGELCLAESGSERSIPSGVYARFSL